jgi:hypothetical protein
MVMRMSVSSPRQDDNIHEHGEVAHLARRLQGTTGVFFLTYGSISWASVADSCTALADGYGVVTVPAGERAWGEGGRPSVVPCVQAPP